ncbi:ParB N-terminal domain-containing protein [Umezawaea sp. Da 62-37]|uniref:ParB N-terminal domain-containing protein n=1 Tax=Umezawaea sp. Da 62-37 TaxID=3075927 RepID=UPI0028F6E45F|nr:ParB N-terminal domain-containing protein [Umezawaea sp. Da 62-37]WNV84983.1 ParB N-terminal domain-containing protein [Umezawaea sp. Da 62-37]
MTDAGRTSGANGKSFQGAGSARSGTLHAATVVPIGSLVVGGSPRSAGEDTEHAKVLSEVQADLPPILVDKATMRVIDGVHRLRAAQMQGRREIEVRFFEGAEGDAFVLAVSENVSHGLPLTLADRKTAAARIMGFRPEWSDRVIALVTGLSPTTVAALRRRPTARVAQLDSRIGRDGRVRPVDGTGGRQAASAFIEDHPDASLREIARYAAISPETARDVRDRLRRGEDPLLPRQRGPRQRVGDAPQVERDAQPRRVTPAEQSLLLESLRRDPSLRLNDVGRTLLRLLSTHSIDRQEWVWLTEGIPAHCVDRVIAVARECAYSWGDFVANLERLAEDLANRGESDRTG